MHSAYKLNVLMCTKNNQHTCENDDCFSWFHNCFIYGYSEDKERNYTERELDVQGNSVVSPYWLDGVWSFHFRQDGNIFAYPPAFFQTE